MRSRAPLSPSSILDTDAFRAFLKDQKIKPVIPGKSNRKKRIRHDKSAYKNRNVIEHCFGRLKDFRRPRAMTSSPETSFLPSASLRSQAPLKNTVGFDLRDDITRAIMAALKLRLAGRSDQPVFKLQTTSAEAYELYLKGRFLCHLLP
jgi:hypothetical protein